MASIIPGAAKSAYIFSVLPPGVRSIVLGELRKTERSRLNEGMKKLADIEQRVKKSILAGFVREMRARRDRRNRAKDESIIAGLGLLAFLLIAATAAAFVTRESTDARIRFIEAVLAGGGAHVALLPVMAGYLKAELRTPVVKLIFRSRSYAVDMALSLCLALCMAAVFIALSGPSTGPGDPIVSVVTLIASSTAGPVVEEIVFRHLLFTVLGKKTGPAVAAAASSVLFAAVHLPDNALVFSAYLAAGTALCIVRHFRKSLFPAVATHALSNIIILIS